MRAHGKEGTGAAIRKLRLAKGFTLAELSDKTGIPLSTLSRVELGQNALNSDKLIRLCRALEVDLQNLVAREAATTPVASGRRAVVRAGEGRPFKAGANAGLRAAGDLTNKALSPAVVDVTAPSLDSHGPMTVLNGEAYLLVLTGEVCLHSPFYAPLPMGVGDGVYFDGRAGYALTVTEGPARVLICAAGEQTLES